MIRHGNTKKKKNEKDEITKKRLLQRAQRWQVPIDSRTKIMSQFKRKYSLYRKFQCLAVGGQKRYKILQRQRDQDIHRPVHAHLSPACPISYYEDQSRRDSIPSKAIWQIYRDKQQSRKKECLQGEPQSNLEEKGNPSILKDYFSSRTETSIFTSVT